MTRDEALEGLRSQDLHMRLQAARLLAQGAEPSDARVLQEVLAVEEVMWVKTALRQALARAERREEGPKKSHHELADIVSPEVFDQIRTIAVNETTKRIVHEVEPIVGVLRMRAKQEVADYEGSKTQAQVDRLQDLVRALDRLSQAAVAPTLSEFDLSDLIRRIVDAEKPDRIVKVELAGPSPLLILGDATLLGIALSNGLRNAIEAVEGIHRDKDQIPPVVVNWGETERDLWIAILDRGPGPPASAARAFEIGSTTKENHLGMGLATARQAIRSLSGDVSLSRRAETGGARFELRWPRTNPAPQ